jgi:hypothetical protein
MKTAYPETMRCLRSFLNRFRLFELVVPELESEIQKLSKRISDLEEGGCARSVAPAPNAPTVIMDITEIPDASTVIMETVEEAVSNGF